MGSLNSFDNISKEEIQEIKQELKGMATLFNAYQEIVAPDEEGNNGYTNISKVNPWKRLKPTSYYGSRSLYDITIKPLLEEEEKTVYYYVARPDVNSKAMIPETPNPKLAADMNMRNFGYVSSQTGSIDPQTILKDTIRALSFDKKFYEDIEPQYLLKFLKRLKGRLQAVVTDLMEFVDKNPPSAGGNSKKSEVKNKQEKKELKKSSELGERIAKRRNSLRNNSRMGSDGEKLVPEFNSKMLEEARKWLNQRLLKFKKETNKKNYGKLVPFIYTNLVQMAPYKVEKNIVNNYLVVQRSTSIYFEEEQGIFEKAIIEVAEKEMGFKVIRTLGLYTMPLDPKDYHNVGAHANVIVITSGCSGGKSYPEYANKLSRLLSFPNITVQMCTNYLHGENCGCSTFRLLEEQLPELEIQYQALDF